MFLKNIRLLILVITISNKYIFLRIKNLSFSFTFFLFFYNKKNIFLSVNNNKLNSNKIWIPIPKY